VAIRKLEGVWRRALGKGRCAVRAADIVGFVLLLEDLDSGVAGPGAGCYVAECAGGWQGAKRAGQGGMRAKGQRR
jgi:hypothetical protein